MFWLRNKNIFLITGLYLAEHSGLVGRALDWGWKGLLVLVSLPAESLSCVL